MYYYLDSVQPCGLQFRVEVNQKIVQTMLQSFQFMLRINCVTQVAAFIKDVSF